jgi:hypothetical protein
VIAHGALMLTLAIAAGPLGSTCPTYGVPVNLDAGWDGPAYVRVVDARPQRGLALIPSIDSLASSPPPPWSRASQWRSVAPGTHDVSVRAGGASASATIHVDPGCRVSVITAEPDPARPDLSVIESRDCTPDRIPPGMARITTLFAADTDFGSLLVRLTGNRVGAVPLLPTRSILLSAGPSTVAIESSDGLETFQSASLDFDAGTTYTILWVGGGETPSTLVEIPDATQPAHPPAPDLQIQTGQVAGSTYTDPRSVSSDSTGERPSWIAIAPIRINQRVGMLDTATLPDLPRMLALHDIAWISGTSPPGEVGTTALVGHTTSSGAGAFAQLATLRPGARVDLTDGGGRIWRYVVTDSVIYPKGGFPASVWSPRPTPTLALITCTRKINPDTGMADNQIIWATLDGD